MKSRYYLIFATAFAFGLSCATKKNRDQRILSANTNSSAVSAEDLKVSDAKVQPCSADSQTFKISADATSNASYMKATICNEDKACLIQTFVGESTPIDYGGSKTLSLEIAACAQSKDGETEELCGKPFKVPDVVLGQLNDNLRGHLEGMRSQEVEMQKICQQMREVVKKLVDAGNKLPEAINTVAQSFQDRIGTDVCRAILLTEGIKELEADMIYQHMNGKKTENQVTTKTVVVTKSSHSLTDRIEGLVFLAIGSIGISGTATQIWRNIRNYRASELAHLQALRDQSLREVGFIEIQEVIQDKVRAEQLRTVLANEVVKQQNLDVNLRQYSTIEELLSAHPNLENTSINIKEVHTHYEGGLETRRRAFFIGEKGAEYMVDRPQIGLGNGDGPVVGQFGAGNDRGIYDLYEQINGRFEVKIIEPRNLSQQAKQDLEQTKKYFSNNNLKIMRTVETHPRFKEYRDQFRFEVKAKGNTEDLQTKKVQNVLDGINDLKKTFEKKPDATLIATKMNEIKPLIREITQKAWYNPMRALDGRLFTDTLDTIQASIERIYAGYENLQDDLQDLHRFAENDGTINLKKVNAYLDNSRSKVQDIARNKKVGLDANLNPKNPLNFTDYDDWTKGLKTREIFEQKLASRKEAVRRLELEIQKTPITKKATEGFVQKAYWTAGLASAAMAAAGASLTFGLAEDANKSDALLDEFNALYLQAAPIRERFLKSKAAVDAQCKF